MTNIIKTQDVINAIEAAVAAKGADYVYNRIEGSCYYHDINGSVENPTPSCIVGFVLAAVAPEVFAQISEREDMYGTSMGINELYNKYDIRFEDENVVLALGHAQGWQDSGKPWGEALLRFHNTLERAEA